jgi:uncharacterized protein (TIGR02270 family)
VRIIEGVINQHAEEAAFLWLLRDAAVRAPNYSLEDLVELDDRLDAHIDGLRIAGDPGWEICKEQLAWEEAGEVFTAALLAFGASDTQRINEVLDVGLKSMQFARGIISALGWLTYEQAQPHAQALLESSESILQRIGITAVAVHRGDLGRALNEAVAKGGPVVRARALRVAGELGRIDLLPLCRANFEVEEEDCRFWAAWSAALLGDDSSTHVLREMTEGGGPMAERACDLVVRRMHPTEALSWQKQMATQEGYRRLSIIAAGAIGDPVLVPWLLDMMKIEDVARPAGEAFTFITGLDLSYEDLERDWPEGFEAGPTEDPEDEDVSMDLDEDLPWPEPKLISKWWSQNQGQFATGTRYLLGNPITLETLGEVLKIGQQRQRAAAALEMALQQRGRPVFEIRAPGYRQQQELRIEKRGHSSPLRRR